MKAYTLENSMNTKFEVGSDTFWIGRHSVDNDTLVFDPATAKSDSKNVVCFSLTQYRVRAFPPAVAGKLIHGITDAKEQAAAKKKYEQWPKLKAEQDDAAPAVRAGVVEQRRDEILERHKAFLATLPVPREPKVVPASKLTKRRRATTCVMCGRDLDVGLDMNCEVCQQPVCRCGACSCAKASQQVV